MSHLRAFIGKICKYAKLTGICDPQEGPEKILVGGGVTPPIPYNRIPTLHKFAETKPRMRQQWFVTSASAAALMLKIFYRSSGGPIEQQQGNNKLLFCEQSDIRQGVWVALPTNETEGNAAKGAKGAQYHWRVHPQRSNGYCRFEEEFQTSLFCDLMENQVILFIGDSLSHEMWVSLRDLAVANGRLGPPRRYILLVSPSGEYQKVCSNTTLVYARSNDLNDIQEVLERQKEFPSVVVMNTGAWYQPTHTYNQTMGQMIDLMLRWQDLCKSSGLMCPFIWRTTAPGTPNCMNFKRPENNVTRMENLWGYGSTQKEHLHPHLDVYHWKDFHHQNEIASEMLGQSGLEYKIIDGYKIGLTRPDQHVSMRDCLHHQSPEVPDAYNIVLLYFLHALSV